MILPFLLYYFVDCFRCFSLLLNWFVRIRGKRCNRSEKGNVVALLLLWWCRTNKAANFLLWFCSDQYDKAIFNSKSVTRNHLVAPNYCDSLVIDADCAVDFQFLYFSRTIHWFGLFDMAVASTNTANHNIYAAHGVRSANLSIIVLSLYL